MLGGGGQGEVKLPNPDLILSLAVANARHAAEAPKTPKWEKKGNRKTIENVEQLSWKYNYIVFL